MKTLAPMLALLLVGCTESNPSIADGGTDAAPVDVPDVPEVPDVSTVRDVRVEPDIPDVADVPVVDLPDVADVPAVDRPDVPAVDVPVVIDAPTAPLPAPRPLFPLPMAAVTSRRPSLRWALAAATDGARVLICRDRACATVEHSLDVTGSVASPPADLAPGVHFWSARSRAGVTTGVASSPAWPFVVGHRAAAVSTSSWAASADFDGDGRADFVAGAPRGDLNAGMVYVFAAGPGAPASAPPVTSIRNPDTRRSGFGGVLVPLGDVNGDGYGDLAVGSAEGGASAANRVYVFHGGPTGLSTTPAAQIDAPLVSMWGYGTVLGAAGDVNGDGYADLLMGSSTARSSPPAARAFVYFGSAAGVSTAPSQTLDSPDASAHFAGGVAGVGDVDGDGRADVVVTAPRLWTSGTDVGPNHAYVYLGTAAGLPASPSFDLVVSSADELEVMKVSPLGDLNGDGRADFGVTSMAGAGDAETVRVFLGAATAPTAPASTIPFSRIGQVVVGAGDVNGDGYGDMLLGSVSAPPAGEVRLYLGGAAGLPASPSATLASPATATGTAFGISAAGFGDGDGDGFADVVIGSLGADRRGRLYVYRGGSSGLGAAPAFDRAGVEPLDVHFGRVVAWRVVPRTRTRVRS